MQTIQEQIYVHVEISYVIKVAFLTRAERMKGQEMLWGNYLFWNQ